MDIVTGRRTVGLRACFSLGIVLCAIGHPLFAQVIAGSPGKNVNIVGPTPDPANVRDILLKQQNEPSCTVRPANPAYIFCAFNDYRATDFPLIQGDSWIGVSWSADFGKTWFSRLAPGFKGHPGSLGMEFAADPSVVSAPGNSPGITILNYIAAFRDLDDGVLAIQRWAEMPQEDINYYSAENVIYIPDTTNSGRFADKPTLRAAVDPPNQQTTQSITMQLEDGTTVVRGVPSATLMLAYSVFTGSNSSKILVKKSRDWGETWLKSVKISEEQVRVQGVSLTNIGNNWVAAWRRSDQKGNAVIFAYSGNDGKTWTKGKSAASICPIDQDATGVQFRSFDFPWLANDGERYFIFVADRSFGGSCETGFSKIAFTWSSDGRNWNPLQAIDTSTGAHPFNEPAGDGFQIIPTATEFRGNVQVAWYDTRRETFGAGLPGNQPTFIRDYLTADGTIVHRKADVYTARLRADASGVIKVSPAVRVSQYRTGLNAADPSSILQETEAHFANAPIFDSGRLAFKGDYISAAVAQFRQREDRKWIQNSLSTGDLLTDREDVFLAWGDHRDLRGRYFPDTGEPTPFTPNNEATAMADAAEPESNSIIADTPTQLADNAKQAIDQKLTAESEIDFAATFGQCIPGDPQDRTRDANVYGSLVSDKPNFAALTPTKPLTGFQRTYPVLITNPSLSLERSFRLRIETQPDDAGPPDFLGQASWNQLPSKAPFDDPAFPRVDDIFVTVPPKSSAARTLFLVTNAAGAVIQVNMYDAGCDPDADTCPVLANIAVGDGAEFLESEFCLDGIGDPGTACELVNVKETHNPDLQNPDLQSPDLQSARLMSPDLQSPDLQSPDLQSPDLQSLGFQTPDLQSPDLQSPDLQSPDLQSPDLQSPDLQSAAYQDITYTLQNIGNVTTTYSADMSFSGLDPGEIQAQLIAWTAYVTGTSRNCEFLPVAENQILASRNLTSEELQSITLPTVDDPFLGPVTFAARPGQVVHVTLRLLGSLEALDSLDAGEYIAATGFGASAHACNDSANIDPSVDCLTLQQEKILLDRSPPVFNVADGVTFTAQADRPGGACVDLVGSGTVSAEDNGEIIEPVCIADATGAAICTDIPSDTVIPIPLNPPGAPTGITCSATDNAGNVSSIGLFVDVQDNGAPVFSSPLATGEPPLVINQPANDPAAAPVQAAVIYPALAATDEPLVDTDVNISCLPASGTTFPLGSTTVECIANDDGFNSAGSVNSVMASFTVTVNDVTPPAGVPPTVATVEANAQGGANFAYPPPQFTDNFDDPSQLIVECSPESPAFLPLSAPGPVTTVSCTATDTSGNSALVSFDLTVADTKAPVFDTVPGAPVVLAAGAGGTASLDFESQVEVSDADGVDPNPSLSCVATAGTGSGASSGDPLPFGSTTVTCSAADFSGNTSEAQFTVLVQFGSSFGIDFSKGKIKAGSSVPLTFGWNDSSGNRADSSDADPLVSARDCATGTVVLDPGQFPGNSDLRYDASQRSWKMNWQTVFMNGTPIPAGPGGTAYCLEAVSGKTGQRIPEIGFTVLTVRP